MSWRAFTRSRETRVEDGSLRSFHRDRTIRPFIFRGKWVQGAFDGISGIGLRIGHHAIQAAVDLGRSPFIVYFQFTSSDRDPALDPDGPVKSIHLDRLFINSIRDLAYGLAHDHLRLPPGLPWRGR